MKRRGVCLEPQRESWDCGVASMASYFNLPYEDVWAASHLVPDKLRAKRGLVIADMQMIAKELGRTLYRVNRSNGYLLNASGILGVIGGDMHWSGHWVVLHNNSILDPDGRRGKAESWAVLDYLSRHQARPGTLLTEDQ